MSINSRVVLCTAFDMSIANHSDQFIYVFVFHHQRSTRIAFARVFTRLSTRAYLVLSDPVLQWYLADVKRHVGYSDVLFNVGEYGAIGTPASREEAEVLDWLDGHVS